MNQLRDWDGHCQRCGVKTASHTMSMFDVALVCIDCYDREKNHYLYKNACSEEEKALKAGNRNFEGIGYTESDVDHSSED